MTPTCTRNGRFLASLLLSLLQDCDFGGLDHAGKDRKRRTGTARAFGTRSWAKAALSQWILSGPFQFPETGREGIGGAPLPALQKQIVPWSQEGAVRKRLPVCETVRKIVAIVTSLHCLSFGSDFVKYRH